MALVAIQSLGPAAKRFYPQLIARLEDEESHLRYLASATLACTFPPAAASRLIVHKMEEGGGGEEEEETIPETFNDDYGGGFEKKNKHQSATVAHKGERSLRQCIV